MTNRLQTRKHTGCHGRRLKGAACALLLALSSTPSIAADFRLSGLSNLNFGRWNGSRDLTGTVTHCVRSTAPGAQFAISILGDGPGGSYELHDGADVIRFHVDYNDGRGWVEALPGRAVAGRRGYAGDDEFQRCLSGVAQRQEVRIRIFSDDLASAPGGSYTGRISLLVMPE